jgi:hypothetical protein
MAGLEIGRNYYTFDLALLVGALASRGIRVGEFLFREAVFEPPAGCAPGVRFVRVRDEGRRAVWTIEWRSPEPRITEEGVVISDYGAGVRMARNLGLKRGLYLEKLREIWLVGGEAPRGGAQGRDYAQSSGSLGNWVLFDAYPGLPPYVTIEGPDDGRIAGLAAELGLVGEPQGTSVGGLYLRLCGVPLELDLPLVELTFENAGLALGPLVARDRELFEARLGAQRRRIAEAQRATAF